MYWQKCTGMENGDKFKICGWVGSIHDKLSICVYHVEITGEIHAAQNNHLGA